MRKRTESDGKEPRASTSPEHGLGCLSQKRHLDDKLDEGLKGTFPASDPIMLMAVDDPNGETVYASPPCFLHELDPSYLGYLGRAETLALLSELLEGERAGARAVVEISNCDPSFRNSPTMRRITKDEARFCAILARHIARLGGTPGTETGDLDKKLAGLKSVRERLELLDRSQARVASKLKEALPRIAEDILREDLRELLIANQQTMEQRKQPHCEQSLSATEANAR